MKKLVKATYVMIALVGLLAVNAYAMMGNNGTMGSFMQMPMAQEMFEYGPTTTPVNGTDVSTRMPIGVGSFAMDGNMITIHTAIGQFSHPMVMYLTVYASAVDPLISNLMHPDGTLKPISMGVEPWMSGVTGVDQTPVSNMPTSLLTKGTYTLGFMATPTGGNMATYYMWTTFCSSVKDLATTTLALVQ